MILWRATRCLRPCDRLSSPSSVMLEQLIIEANEKSHSCHCSLPEEFKSDGTESCKGSKTL